MLKKWRAKQALRDILLIKQVNNQIVIMTTLRVLLNQIESQDDKTIACYNALASLAQSSNETVVAFTDLIEKDVKR